jgi:hypothetical protein
MRHLVGVVLLWASIPAPGIADEIAIPARNLSAKSSNVAAEYPDFGDLTLCVGRNGFMEWSAEVEGGVYYVHVLYCSGEPRPCRMSISGRMLDGDVLGEVTGGFMPADLVWKTLGPIDLARGSNRIRIEAVGFMPHLKGLFISRSAKPPVPSVFPPAAVELADFRTQFNLDGLRNAVRYLAGKYPDGYLRAANFLAQIDALDAKLSTPTTEPAAVAALIEGVRTLRREALIKDNPLLASGRIVFIKRQTYQSSHYYTDFIDGCRYFGGNLCVLSLADGCVTELAPSLARGIFGRYDLDFDAQRVVFDWKAAPGEGFRIWEVGLDGTGLRQVTFPPSDESERIAKYWQRDSAFLKSRQADYRHHTDDMHPCYLPDGGICFVSTRCERGILCDGPDVLTASTLYRMDRAGGHLQVLSESPVSESSPSVMNDGRVLYTRWEYVDKADVVIKCLWAMRPDGTNSAEVFGNDITFPDTMLHGRAVPGSNNLFAVIGAPHMPAGAGTVIRLNVNYPIRTRRPMTYITPDVDVRSEFGWVHRQGDRWVANTSGPLYTDAQPLDEKFFLVSCNTDRKHDDPAGWGLCLIDEFGNRDEIHREATTSCWQPMLLQPRRRPEVIPSGPSAKSADDTAGSRTLDTDELATVVMSDVYSGLNGIPRGTVKYLRVMETVARPWSARHFWDGDSAYQQHAVVSMNTHLHVKRTYGVVPVASDGSAHFRVPAKKNLFFQALDEDFMEVQRMRTFVNMQSGETRSCIGCHQPRELAPQAKRLAALERPADNPAPQPGDSGPRPISYATDVQPILDKHCVECHNADRTDGNIDLSGELTTLFCRSYENLVSRDWVKVFRENDPKTGDASPIPPYTLGSHASRLVQLIRQGHENVQLSREEFIRLVTWVDANAPYYGSYYGRRNLKYQTHPDFRPIPTMETTLR